MFKRSVVIKANKLKPIAGISPDYKSIIFFTFFVCGIILGVIIIKKSQEDFLDFFMKLLNNRLGIQKNSSWLMNFCSDFLWLFVLIFLDFVLGLCAVGVPFIWLIPVLFGCFAGCVLSVYYMNFGLNGLAFCGLVNIPSYAITAATLIKCCCESTRVSNEIFYFVLRGKTNESPKDALIKDYSMKYVTLCLPVLLAALISSGSFKLFSGLFTFI